MPRYIVERTIPAELALTGDAAFHRRNAELGVTWSHSYLSADGRTSFCVYEAPNPDAIRATAAANGLPVDRITPVQILDPHRGMS